MSGVVQQIAEMCAGLVQIIFFILPCMCVFLCSRRRREIATQRPHPLNTMPGSTRVTLRTAMMLTSIVIVITSMLVPSAVGQ